MDFSKMLKQAQEMQQKMMEAKDGLKNQALKNSIYRGKAAWEKE